MRGFHLNNSENLCRASIIKRISFTAKGFRKCKKERLYHSLSDSLREYDELLNTLSKTSNLLTGRQQKTPLAWMANWRWLRHIFNVNIQSI